MRWGSTWQRFALGAALLLGTAGCGQGFTMRPEGGPPELSSAGTGVPDLDGGESCGAHSAESLMQCVDGNRIEQDILAIAKPRPPTSKHHLTVRNLCTERLAALGFGVRLHAYGTGANVIGIKPGFSKPQKQVILSAHYDSQPSCPGADDNASGLAVLLETARVLATARFDHSLLIACWDQGEARQLGSAAYAREAQMRGDHIVAMVSYEAVGYASSEPGSQQVPNRFEEAFPEQALTLLDHDHRADFLTVVAETATEPSAAAIVGYGQSLGLPVHVLSLTERQKVKQQDLHRSDHTSFWDLGFPALLLTDTGRFRNPHLHCQTSQDSPATLDYRFTAAATRAGLGAAVDLLLLR